LHTLQTYAKISKKFPWAKPFNLGTKSLKVRALPTTTSLEWEEGYYYYFFSYSKHMLGL